MLKADTETKAKRAKRTSPAPSINLRELRNTRRLKAWLQAGRTVELRERDRVIGHIVPETQEGAPANWPDFEARRKAIFGDRVIPAVEILIEERGRY
jgi:hypothetical protein